MPRMYGDQGRNPETTLIFFTDFSARTFWRDHHDRNIFTDSFADFNNVKTMRVTQCRAFFHQRLHCLNYSRVLLVRGYANQCTPAQLAMAITPRTAAILYIKSHHCVQKSHLSIEQAVTVARQHHVPLIVDAAAEEDLQYYSHCGADLVIYSGAKAIEGPASGLVAGRGTASRRAAKISFYVC